MFIRKITEDIRKLKPKEVVTYLALALKSDYRTLQSAVNEETLAKELDISLKTVYNHIKKFKDTGLVTINTKYLNKDGNTIKKNFYQLSSKHYDEIEVKRLLELPINSALKGFLVLLKAMCLDCSNICKLPASEIAEYLVIGKRSIETYLKQAEDLGYISRKDGVIKLLDDEIFRIPRETEKRLYLGVYSEAFDDDDFNEKGKYIGK